jgi:hypothetical protein
MHKSALAVISALTVSGCGLLQPSHDYTLYRTSSMDRTLRIHWASFDAHESDPNYNLANCEMAARLLNANMKTLGGEDYDPGQGFWCEAGGYSEKGDMPSSFKAAFPTDI